MPKSKYPNQLDTSIEIPPVRDNILEIGSDVINSLRSAIFNIEKTLGINPQGAVGNSVSERISKSLDGNGNIKPEALSRANLLTGPIIDTDVSNVASIKESKLKLDFPTKVLQDEISTVSSNFNNIISQIEELTAQLLVHINPASLNRHPANSISVTAYNSVGSDIGIKDLSAGTVQSSFESLFDSHINYSGQNISLTNNSHTADQIYFDNTNVSGTIFSNNLQASLEDLAKSTYGSEISHQDYMHSNGVLRSGSIESSDVDGVGNILASNISVTFAKSTATSPTSSLILINDVVAIGDFNLEKSDLVTLSVTGGTAKYTGTYEILSFEVISGELKSVTVWGIFPEASSSVTRARISKRIKKVTNLSSLLTSIREEALTTSSRSIQICNPNSVRVISSNINPLEITTAKRFIDISINEGTPVTLDLYYSSATRQTIDSIIRRFNEQCAENAYNFLAYRLDLESGGSELVIAHNLPDFIDEKYTIKISRSTDDGIDAAGFSSIEDKVIQSEYGTSYYINGQPFEGLNSKLNSTKLIFLSGSTVITSATTDLDFLALGIKKFDLITITGASQPSDDGTYVIMGVTANQLSISVDQIPAGFGGSSSETTKFRIFSNVASFDGITFDEVSGTYGISLCDIFMDVNRNIFINKRFEHVVKLSGTKSVISIVDFEGSVSDVQLKLNVDKFKDYLLLNLDNGPEVQVRGVDNYIWVKSGDHDLKLKFYISDVDDIIPSSSLVLSGLDLYGFSQENLYTGLKVARIPFDNYTGGGRIVGSESSGRIFSKLEYGNISSDEISTSAKATLITLPRGELRSNGVVKGLEVSNLSLSGQNYKFDLQSGVYYIQGKRIALQERIDFITDINALVRDKIFIGLNEFGEIIVQAATPSCESPFEPSMYCILGTVEYTGSNLYFIDMRLFINDLDLKLLNSITVSPEPGMGHFSRLGDALRYAKRFNQAYPNAGVPTVHLKSGVYSEEINIKNDITYAAWLAKPASETREELLNALSNRGLLLDFPVNIIGEGDSTELAIRLIYSFTNTLHTKKGSLAILGDGLTTTINFPTTRLRSGVLKISNLKMNNSKILLFDLNITDGAANLPFMVDIDGVTFDQRDLDTPNLFDYGFKSIEFVEGDDVITNKGNVTINNCRFIADATLASGYAIYIASPIRTKNIYITNNKITNTGPNVSLLSADIVTLTNADSGSNIVLLGNMALGSTGTADGSRSEIYSGGNTWSDRISRDLTIGRNIIATDFLYHQERNITKTYYFDKTNVLDEYIFNSIFVTAPTINRLTYTNPDSLTYKLTYATIPNLAAISIPINDLPNNCKISSVRLGLRKVVGVNYSVRLVVAEISKSFFDSSGQRIEQYNNTQSDVFLASSSRIKFLTYDLSSLSIMTNASNTSFLEIKNLETTDLDVVFAEVNLSFTSLTDAVGII